jgi:Holliday junction resolvase RusA-like endonuclease
VADQLEPVRFVFPRSAVPASRPRVTRSRTFYGGAYGVFLPWAREYAAQNWRAGQFPGTVAVGISCVLERVKSHYGTGKNSGILKASAPGYPRADVDNLAKGVLDALTGHAWKDDSQVVELSISKTYGPRGETVVHIERAALGDPFGAAGVSVALLPGIPPDSLPPRGAMPRDSGVDSVNND